MSVTTLLAMPSARGLFRRAITQSGAAAHTLTPEIGLTVTRTLAEALGVEPTREAIAAVDLDRAGQAPRPTWWSRCRPRPIPRSGARWR